VKRKEILNSLTLRFTAVSAVLLLVFISGCTLFKRKPTRLEQDSGQLYSYILEYAGNQVDVAFGRLGGGYPIYSENGRWVETEFGGWARGLYPGMVWLLYQSTQDQRQFKLANDWMNGLDKHKKDKSSFGLGLVFYPAYVIGYQITGNRAYRSVALEAAESLSERFTEAGFFPAFGEPGDTLLGRRLSIESMMDLELLYWASEATGNNEYAAQANQHALFTMRCLVSNDGRILHMADFNPKTGRIQGEKTGVLADNKKYSPKGYSSSSVWALGQAWAIHGFTTAYRHEGKTLFLNVAQRVAEYFIENLPEDGVPLWDFELPPGETKRKDTGAAAVAAASLIKLARATPTESDARRYRDAAYKIISSLNRDYFAKAGGQGILGGGLYDEGGKQDVGATAWGDYFYIEALLLLRDFRT